jgi:hypothetical protein
MTGMSAPRQVRGATARSRSPQGPEGRPLSSDQLWGYRPTAGRALEKLSTDQSFQCEDTTADQWEPVEKPASSRIERSARCARERHHLGSLGRPGFVIKNRLRCLRPRAVDRRSRQGGRSGGLAVQVRWTVAKRPAPRSNRT